jgi:hypothetical protein
MATSLGRLECGEPRLPAAHARLEDESSRARTHIAELVD